MAYFYIIPGDPSVNLPPSRRGQVTFTVTNKLDRPVRIQASARPDDKSEAKAQWLSISGETERDLAPNETKTFLVQLQVPATVPAGEYRFHLLVASVDRPDDEYDTSPQVAFTIPAAPVADRRWILVAAIVAAAVLIIAGVGILVFIPRAPGLGKPCPKGECAGELVCSQPEGGGERVCLSQVGAGCAGDDECVTGVCQDGGTGTVCTASCSPETDAAFCSRLGRACGSVEGTDNCGNARAVSSCGTCANGASCQNGSCGSCGGVGQPCCDGTCMSPNSCGGGGTAGVCGCTREPDAAFCSRLGKACGSVSGADNCQVWRTVSSCGTCASGTTCQNNSCVACGGAGQPCCSGGTCTSPNKCGGAGVAGMCGCTRETDAAFCSRLGKACGSVRGTDNCGYARMVSSCGSCPSGRTCQNNACISCGGPGQVCCLTGTQCSRGTCTGGFCKVTLPACQWSLWFSEEGSGLMNCSNGWAVRGVKCSGKYCDNMSLYCCPYTDLADRVTPADTGSWFSEEQPRTNCSSSAQLLGGLRCNGDYCDNLKLRCLATPKLLRSGTCYNAQAISEEQSAGYRCNAGYWVAGMQCTGKYCDNVSVTCCPAQPTFK